MMKKYLVRTRALMVAVVMAFTTMACGVATSNDAADTQTQKAEQADAEEKTLEENADSSSFGVSSASDKEETVYVMTDANGAANNVVVSEWLKNSEGSKELTDATTLSDVTNVKGDGTYTKNADGTITWDAEGSDVYYQGTTNKEVPVEVKVTYYLDGKEIAPEALAGQSGKVTIRFDYTNNDVKNVNINGEETKIYTPYAMVSGAMLDSDHFSNVEVTNGKVISEGNSYVVMGVALPGLKESLSIDEDKLDELNDKAGEDLEIPDYVEITADAKDFTLDMTMTYATGNALTDLGFDDLGDSLDLDNVTDQMDELTDGTQQLVDGSGDLYDGTVTMKDGTKTLADGSADLFDGAAALANGAIDLKDGTADLAEGAAKLKTGTGSLRTGAGTLKNGTSQLASGAASLKNGTSQLASGAASLKNGTSQLASGAGTLSSGASTLNSGITAYTKGVSDLKTGAAQLSAGLTTLQTAISSSDLGKVSTALSSLAATTAKLYTGASQLEGNLTLMLGSYGYTAKPSLNADGSVNTTVEKQDIGTYIYARNAQAAEYTSDAGTAMSNLTEAVKEYDNYLSTAQTTMSLQSTYVQDENSAENASTDASKKASADAAESSSEKAAVEEGKTETSGEADTIDASENKTSEDNAAEGADESAKAVVEDEIHLMDGTDSTSSLMEIDSVSTILAELKAGTSIADLNVMKQYTTAIKNAEKITSENNLLPTLIATRDNLYSLEAALGTISNSLSGSTSSGSTDASQLAALSKSIQALVDGANQISAGLTQLEANNAALTSGSSQLASGAATLASGASTLDSGAGTLADGASTLDSGAGTLTNGASTLDSGTQTLVDGAVALDNGMQTLSDGASTLDSGAGTLSDGTADLEDGAGKVKDGASKLEDGASDLSDGAKDLSDGIVKLDKDGISKIAEVFDGSLEELQGRLEALSDAAEDTQTFGGAAKDTDTSVKYIIKTAGITTSKS